MSLSHRLRDLSHRMAIRGEKLVTDDRVVEQGHPLYEGEDEQVQERREDELRGKDSEYTRGLTGSRRLSAIL